MQTANRTAEKKNRFKIEKLEERIAPSCYVPPSPCHGSLINSISVKLNVKLSLGLGIRL